MIIITYFCSKTIAKRFMRFSKILFKLPFVCIAFTSALLIGCKSGDSHERVETTVIYAPLKEKVNPDSLPLRSVLFQKTDTVRLKTDNLEGCLDAVRDVKVTDDYIFVQSADERLLMYGINGAFIRQIGLKGRGRGEYTSLQSFDIRPGKDELYLCETLGDNILIYSFQGEFLRKISPANLSNAFAVKDDGHLLFLSLYGNTEKGYDGGVYEADADGNYIKMIFTLPEYYMPDTYSLFSHISADEIGCMGYEDEDYIYRIKGDSVYRPYRIKTDIVMGPDELKKRRSYQDENAYYKDLYHETDKLLTFMVAGAGKIARIYYDKVNGRTYRLVDYSDVKPSPEESFSPFTSSYMGKLIRVHDVLNILRVPELKEAFPDITEESNPVILIYQ